MSACGQTALSFDAFMHVFILESCVFGYFCRSPSVSVVVFASFVFLALPCPGIANFLSAFLV